MRVTDVMEARAVLTRPLLRFESVVVAKDEPAENQIDVMDIGALCTAMRRVLARCLGQLVSARTTCRVRCPFSMSFYRPVAPVTPLPPDPISERLDELPLLPLDVS